MADPVGPVLDLLLVPGEDQQALDRLLPPQPRAGLRSREVDLLGGLLEDEGLQGLVVEKIALLLLEGDLVEGGLGDVDVGAVDEEIHVAEEEGEEEGADVGTVHVGVGHDDDLVVPEVLEGELLGAETASDGGDQGPNLVVGDELLHPLALLHIQDLSLEGKDGLESPVAALLGRAAGRIPLHDVELALGRIVFLAVGQLPREIGSLENILSLGELPGLAGGLPGLGREDRLVGDGPGHGPLLLEGILEGFGEEGLHGSRDPARPQLGLGLSFELGVGNLDADDGGETLADVLAPDLFSLVEILVLDEAVHHPGEGGPEPPDVGPTLPGGDVVDVA